MREKPIIFSGEMVRAILAGRKTMTRRIVKPQPKYIESMKKWHPSYIIGNLLWVREIIHKCVHDPEYMAYAADDEIIGNEERSWPSHGEREIIPSIYMPRWASRLTLEIVDVDIERLQRITPEEAVKEGMQEFIKEELDAGIAAMPAKQKLLRPVAEAMMSKMY